MAIRGRVDLSGLNSGLDKLRGEIAQKLASSMLVAAGKVVRDEAKMRVPMKTGRLKESIYLARDDKKSKGPMVVYNVSWNSRKAPHGYLIEFGHWHYLPAQESEGLSKRGRVATRRGRIKADIIGAQWVPAHPFLRPAYDATKGRLLAVMTARGRERLPELLRGASGPGDSEEWMQHG